MLQNARRLYIAGEHASTHQLDGKWKKKIFKRKLKYPIIMRTARHTSPNPRLYSIGHSLAHLLYPKNFPKILASGLPGHSPQGSFRITYSKKAKLTKESQSGIEGYYKSQIGSANGAKDYSLHVAGIIRKAENLAFRIYQESGLSFNSLTMNTGKSVKKNVIYFELDNIYLPRTISFVEKMPQETPAQKLRKKQAYALLEALGKFDKNETGLVQIHSIEP